jgi:hypothetical protein
MNRGSEVKVNSELSAIEQELKVERGRNQRFSEILEVNSMDGSVDLRSLEGNITALLDQDELSEAQKRFLNSQLMLIKSIKDSVSVLNQLDQFMLDSITQLHEGNFDLKGSIDSMRSVWRLKDKERQKELRRLRSTLDMKTEQLRYRDKIKVITFMSSKGKKVHYLGEVVNEKAEGGGIGIWSTGGMYQGDWENNQRYGEGRYEWSNEHVYVGEFKNDVREGEGIYYWPSGERYEGEWIADKRSGLGTLYDKNGNIQYEGKWKNDKVVD